MLHNKDLRKLIAWMTWHSKEGHIPSAYSIIDIVELLYTDFLKFSPLAPNDPERDYFILSKGHGCAALYAVLYKIGLLSKQDLLDKNGEFAKLATHPDRSKIPGVEASTGSLGNGIGFAAGIANGVRLAGKSNKVLALVGDAESNEGTVWETALLARHLMLGNFCVILDNNGSCNPTLSLFDVSKKWDAFGWETYSVDGHDRESIYRLVCSLDFNPTGRPKCIVANTLKGKGVREMEENYGGWHSKVPNDAELQLIYSRIDEYE